MAHQPANGGTIQRALARAKAVKQKYQAELLGKKNVVGVGLGFKIVAGQISDEIAIIVNVRQKTDASALPAEDVIPAMLDGVPVDVVEVGTFRAQ
ncbi:MAG: hypothetical protein ACE5G8_01520 [Anaerolineae bacterium]